MRSLQTAACSALLGVGLSLANAGCRDDANAFIMSQQHRVTAPGESATEAVAGGYTCSNVASGGGSTGGGSRADDFWVAERTDASGLYLEVGSFDEVLVTRHYDRSFIAAHALDQFVVTTRGGVEYAFVYWGGSSCESCPPDAYTPLPGNLWGCGADAGPGVGATP
jgi:hypothetical protein